MWHPQILVRMQAILKEIEGMATLWEENSGHMTQRGASEVCIQDIYVFLWLQALNSLRDLLNSDLTSVTANLINSGKSRFERKKGTFLFGSACLDQAFTFQNKFDSFSMATRQGSSRGAEFKHIFNQVYFLSLFLTCIQFFAQLFDMCPQQIASMPIGLGPTRFFCFAV